MGVVFGGSLTTRTKIVACALAIAAGFAAGHAQAPSRSGAATGTASIDGHVRDSANKLVGDAEVSLQITTESGATSEAQIVRSDSEGVFRFRGLRAGTYSLSAEAKGIGRATAGSVILTENEVKTIDLVLRAAELPGGNASRSPEQSSATATAKPPEFFDEPKFTVAGVTPPTSSGGHGSDTVLRNSEALVKDTAALGKESETVSTSKESAGKFASADGSIETNRLQQERGNLKAQLARIENQDRDGSQGARADASVSRERAELYHRLAQIDEKLGSPLEAVREYQRAAEFAPSEANLFDWATELLTHRALEPATEVFAKGSHLYPQSVRMLIGLGVAWYARGAYDRAAQALESASDLAPEDSTAYVFMGKMQSVETVPSQETLERLARFQRLAPDNALANYYYAVSLWKWKQAMGTLDDASSVQVETLLRKAAELDAKLGAAQLQLGILYAQRGDYGQAISAYKKAIAVSPELEEAHYRLALAYRRTGDNADARKELQLHERLSKRAKEDAERDRAEIQQFVISLRDR